MNHLLIVDDNPFDRELARGLLARKGGVQIEFASNGLEALEHLEASTPLAILTDLRMPEMDGLSLVRAVRRRFAAIPIVLMTAHGNEEIALEALVEGAADYVPKRRLAADLARVIDGVLFTASGDARHEQIAHCLRYTQQRYEMASQLDLIPPLADQLQQEASHLGLIDRADRVRLARCLAEALRNAVCHGNGGGGNRRDAAPDRSPQVYVTAEFTPADARFVIRDEGRGFDPATIPSPHQSPSRLTDDSGRGLALIRLFMDEVSFNAAGNEITLVKRGKRDENSGGKTSGVSQPAL